MGNLRTRQRFICEKMTKKSSTDSKNDKEESSLSIILLKQILDTLRDIKNEFKNLSAMQPVSRESIIKEKIPSKSDVSFIPNLSMETKTNMTELKTKIVKKDLSATLSRLASIRESKDD